MFRLLCWIFTACVTSVVSAVTPTPNIVHILIDDLGWQDIACYYRDQHDFEPFYETPHMDRLSSLRAEANEVAERIDAHRRLMRYEQRAVNQIRKAARIKK